MRTAHFLRHLLASSLACGLLLQAGVSYADDTEIFFGGSAVDEGIRPNVLFILDDSGSMSGSRMNQLKSAFSSIISNAGNINVGVMAMNKKSDGSRILAPVRPIDEPINVKLSSPAIIVSGDDASHSSSGATNIDDPTLLMGYEGNAQSSVVRSLGTQSGYSNEYASYYVVTKSSVDYACSSKISEKGTVCPAGLKAKINSRTNSSGNDGILLFRNLNVPAGATISSARLVLERADTTTPPKFQVRLERSKSVAAFNNDSPIDSSHDFSDTALHWSGTPTLSGNELSFDLTGQLQHLGGIAPAGNPIGDLALRIRGTSNTSAEWWLGDGEASSPALSPRIEIEWSGGPTSASTRSVGLRFQNVAIPKGATITSARIDFVPAASDDRPVTFKVTAQNIADAPVFEASTLNFEGRTQTTTQASWTPAEWRTSSPQIHVEGPVVTHLVQSVIDSNADWCGNNSMAFFITPASGSGSRTAISVDAGSELQPVLNVSYSGGDDGCLNPILDISLIDTKDDATQKGDSGSDRTPNLTSTTLSFKNSYIASRYQKVPVKRGAIVQEARIFVTPNNTYTGNATVYVEQTGNSSALSTASNNLKNRFPSGVGISCSFTPVEAGTPVACESNEFKNQLQALFARSDWADGNALTLLLQPSSSNLEIRSRDYSANAGITLQLKLESGGLGENAYTIREYTNGIVQALPASGGTPIVPTLYDAAAYYTQYPDRHKSAYPSPITSSCQANYLVLLTDGEANGNGAQSSIQNLIGSSCSSDSSNSSEQCGRTLVKWLATEDQANHDGLNTITTHTIGFNTSNNATATKLLNELATLGGGKAYQANNASELANAFDEIVQAALATNTSFVNTSVPVNSFNRTDNLDELYFALFRPSETDRWVGNLKRYRLSTENGVASIIDADDSPAMDNNTGFFKSNARSFWSTSQDGSDIAKGGAALKLPTPANRKLFTSVGGAKTLESLITNNSKITGEMLGDSSMTTVERAGLLEYIRGIDIDASNNKVNRQALGDPIHSSPRLVTYGCSSYSNGTCTSPDLSAIMGTNEGFIHAFDTRTGQEQFAFMPEALLPNIKQLRNNAKSTTNKPRLYGMDSPVALWVNDKNRNGVIYGDPKNSSTSGLNEGEFVYAYATMGRGGRNLYALDITDRGAPKLLWQIIGGTTSGFEKLGQTWSVPVKTKIKVGNQITDVLIFAGGYDPRQDDDNHYNSTYQADSMGNAIYIVNARTGAKIWSAGNDSSHTLNLSKMKYSIPSSVRVIDIQENNGALVLDPEQLADQFFVGDMGGQLWRFYINNGASGSGLVSAGGTQGDGLFASIGNASTAAGARRFYNEPDVSLLNVNGKRSLTVNIGSGYRGHPLNKFVEDRFYSFRTEKIVKGASEASVNEGTLNESRLYNATENLIQIGTEAQKTSARNAFAATAGGWYIALKGQGEKVLSRALTVAGQTYFNTYEPSAATAACSAAVGVNRSYSVRLLDATPTSVAVNGNGSYNDRYSTSKSEGIAGDPQVICQGSDCYVLPDPSLPPEKVPTPALGKTYWIDDL